MKRCLILLLAMLSPPCFATEIPVFRYALERWQPGPYQVVVFPYSESSLTVYVDPPDVPQPTIAVGPIRVAVQLLASQTGPDGPWVPCVECPTATLTFNSDPSNPPVQNLVDDFGNPIAEDFGPQVAGIVEGCTEPDKSLSWETRKTESLARLLSAPFEVKAVLCADKLHNVRTLREDLETYAEHFAQSRGR